MTNENTELNASRAASEPGDAQASADVRVPASEGATSERPRRSRGWKPVRNIVPGQFYLVTCEIVHRQYLLRPDPVVNQIVEYYMHVYAEEHGIELHQLTVMGTHYHLPATDTRGELPDFVMNVNRSIAQDLQKHHGFEGEVFVRAEPDYCPTHGAKASVKEIAYSIANPVAAGAVRKPEQWPGVCTSVQQMDGRPFTIKRPSFRGKRSVFPESVTGRYTMPQALLDKWGSLQGAQEALQAAVDAHVREAHATMKSERRKFTNADHVRALSPFKQATEPRKRKRGEKKPRYATYGLSPEEAKAVREAWWAFQLAYRAARERFLAGDPDVVWPHGTWAMVQRFGQVAAAAA